MGLPSTSQNNFASIPGGYTIPDVEVRLIFAESGKRVLHTDVSISLAMKFDLQLNIQSAIFNRGDRAFEIY